MKQLLTLILFSIAAAFAAAAFADGQAVYKWTDADGVVHYSDKPPQTAPADLTTLDLPALPPQDPAKIAADQAAEAASTAANLQLLQAQLALQQQQLNIQLQQAQLQAVTAPAATDSTDAGSTVAYPIYVRSAFVPRIYRHNLYRPQPARPDPGTPVMRPAPHPAKPIAVERPNPS